MPMPINDSLSTRPYLIRAIFEWCVDQGLTPYLVVMVDERVVVPKEFIKNGEIVLNISPDATGALKLGNEWVEFKARFGGVARDILVPVDRVSAIYARENGQGMSFPKASPLSMGGLKSVQAGSDVSLTHQASKSGDKPLALQMVFSSDTTSEKTAGQDLDGTEDPTPPTPPVGGNLKSHLKRIK